ncbi:MAG: hypothetical protein NTY02_19685, partial [Acidobacteria bacterium]|nr:hypothetical protein [Acidobacteriota bacterium]
LVATVERPGAPLLLEPTPEEVAASAAVAARLSDNRVERMSLQQSILLALAQRRFSAAEPWIRTTERDVRAELDADLRMDRQYAALVSKSIRKAAEYAATGNVGRLEKLIADVRTSDAQLGHRRPDELQALDASLADAIEIARSTRMSLDRWQFRVETYGDYRGKVDSSVKRLAEVTPDIEAVRALAGPDPRRLPKLEDRITTIAVALLPLSPPSELREAHDALRTSLDLMRDAARLRRQAFSSGSMETAYNASAAAAGALMLLQNATTRIDDYFRRPFQP